jgi:hypothetical protein
MRVQTEVNWLRQDHCRILVSMAMNILIPQKAENFLSSYVTFSSSRPRAAHNKYILVHRNMYL